MNRPDEPSGVARVLVGSVGFVQAPWGGGQYDADSRLLEAAVQVVAGRTGRYLIDGAVGRALIALDPAGKIIAHGVITSIQERDAEAIITMQQYPTEQEQETP
ncbi:hypothetical protein [Streptomyces sp. NPDC047097]|uniref:hypothetical protein n=1 Tax=Streptomyces sp. NPDC047097 TaxID=3155260 RepID=UPI0033F446A9